MPLAALGWVRTPKLLSQPIQAAARAPWRSEENRNVCAICPQPGGSSLAPQQGSDSLSSSGPQTGSCGERGSGREAIGGSHSSFVSLSLCLGAGQGPGALLCPPTLVWSSACATPLLWAVSVSAYCVPGMLVHQEVRARLQFQLERALHTGVTSHPVA